MNLIQIARETIKITQEESYQADGRTVSFPKANYDNVLVISPKMGEDLLAWDLSQRYLDGACIFEVCNADSYQAAHRLENPLVMNFANAHNPGGGFLLGATAQEEALCRCSTLYASIHSREAAEMYRYNNSHLSTVESDYMLLSPDVLVFRNEKCELLEEPFHVGVVTIPAPNRRGAAMLTSSATIRETMLRRIRIMLRMAANHGYKNLVLGAWGCGAFGNNPKEVAAYFKQVLVEEEYGRCFEKVCFAIYGKEDGRNITAFREQFGGEQGKEDA
ncbi:MAG: TIGR02452 family protein [Lachnospiraceae bacterium]|nr:TIGR02452 family protein [Lachnospiraceae bacterium]